MHFYDNPPTRMQTAIIIHYGFLVFSGIILSKQPSFTLVLHNELYDTTCLGAFFSPNDKHSVISVIIFIIDSSLYLLRAEARYFKLYCLVQRLY